MEFPLEWEQLLSGIFGHLILERPIRDFPSVDGAFPAVFRPLHHPGIPENRAEDEDGSGKAPWVSIPLNSQQEFNPEGVKTWEREAGKHPCPRNSGISKVSSHPNRSVIPGNILEWECCSGGHGGGEVWERHLGNGSGFRSLCREEIPPFPGICCAGGVGIPHIQGWMDG